MSEITVIDSLMGSGKTTWAIDKINSIDKCIYITPFLDEIYRIHEKCEHIYTPEYGIKDVNNKLISKTDQFSNLISMLIDKQKICITHALFQRIPLGMIELLKNSGYVIILDEVLEIVTDAKISGQTIAIMKGYNLISIDENGIVNWNDEVFDSLPNNEYMYEFQNIRTWSKEKRLVLINNKFYFWQFPIELFNCFNVIYILTYLFEYSIMNYYFKKYDIQYKLKSIKQVDNKYELCEYYKPDLSKYKELVNIYIPKNSKLDKRQIEKNKYGMFSATWYDVLNENDTDIKKLHLDITNYRLHYNDLECTQKNSMWTVYKGNDNETQKKLIGSLLKENNFAACNLRSTNLWSDKINLFYLINRYMNPTIKNNYFQYQKINEDGYALSEMIQWIWRSAIRNDQKINVFVPSVRMRNILIKWLNDETI